MIETIKQEGEAKMILYAARSNGNIDEICDEIHSKMLAVRIDKSIALKFKLYLENIFIDLTDKQITNFQVEVWKQYCSIKIKITYGGEKFNPLNLESYEDENEFNRIFYANTKIDAKYLYHNEDRQNQIIIHQKILDNFSLTPIILAFVLSIVSCIFISCFFSDIRVDLSKNILQPFISAYIQILMLVVCPMIFFSIVVSIAGFESFADFSKIARTFLKRVTIISITVLIVGFIIGISLFSNIHSGFDVTMNEFSLKILTDIIPVNIFQPFLDANLLQIILLGILGGIGILSLGEKKKQLIDICILITNAIMYILKLISKGIPLLIFASTLNMFLGFESSATWKLIFVIVLIHVVIIAVMLIYTFVVAKSTKTKPMFLFRALLPSFLIAFSSASSYSARMSMYDCASKVLKADDRTSKLLIDIGSIIFWVGSLLYRTIAIAYICNEFNIATIIIVGAAILVITMATPSLPCGGITTAAILLQICKVDPAIGLPLFILIDMLTDNITTGANVYCVLLEVQNSKYKNDKGR